MIKYSNIILFHLLFVFQSLMHPSLHEKKQPVISYSYRIIEAQEQTFGYDIFQNNRIFIHQLSVPAISGNKGFPTKTDAEKVAILVVQKLRQNIMPPTISKSELDSLHIKINL